MQPLCEILLYLTDKMLVCEFLEAKEMMNLKCASKHESESAHLVTDKMIRKSTNASSDKLTEEFRQIGATNKKNSYEIQRAKDKCGHKWLNIQLNLFRMKHKILDTDKDFLMYRSSSGSWETTPLILFTYHVENTYKKYNKTEAGKLEKLTSFGIVHPIVDFFRDFYTESVFNG